MTYRESLEKEKITLNGNDYVPLEKVKEILDEIERMSWALFQIC